MSRDDRKRQKKQRRDKKKQRAYALRRAKRDQYPRFDIQAEDGVDAALCAAVNDAAARFC
jgi:hypothetical protein